MTETVDAPELQPIKLTRKDFVADQEVRWCPGCGDYSILAQTQKVMPDFGVPKENIVFISGIGCSGRLPYYMNTYGFHTIHGRAPTLATGLKAARPGPDGLGHHRRRRRAVDRRQPLPALDAPERGPHDDHAQQPDLRADQGPGLADVGVRQADEVDADGLGRPADHSRSRSRSPPRRRSSPARSTPTRSTSSSRSRPAGRHRGAAFVEVLQNCNIFNDGAWKDFTDRDVRDDRMLFLEHGKPMIFGKERDQGIRLNGLHPEVVTIGENGITEDDLLVHDAHAEDPYLALILSRMFWPDFPVPVGVFRDVDQPTHSDLIDAQIEQARAKSGEGDLAKALLSGETWTVE